MAGSLHIAALSVAYSEAAVVAFQATCSLAGGANISGTLTINNTTGIATAVNLVIGALDSTAQRFGTLPVGSI